MVTGGSFSSLEYSVTLVTYLFILELKEQPEFTTLRKDFIAIQLRGNLKKKSIFKDNVQIKVEHPPSYPIFDKLFFDKF